MTAAKRQADREGGFAMIMVLCVGALFVALAAALMYAASLVTAAANRQLVEQEVFDLAYSFSNRLDHDLTGYDETVTTNGSFGLFADDFLHSSTYRDVTTLNFQCEPGVAGGADSLSVKLTKAKAADRSINGEKSDPLEVGEEIRYNGNISTLQGYLNSYEKSSGTEHPEKFTKEDYVLDVAVTAVKGSTSFTYTQSYRCATHYNIYYTLGDSTAEYSWVPPNAEFRPISGGSNVTIADGKLTKVTVHFRTSNYQATNFTNFAG